MPPSVPTVPSADPAANRGNRGLDPQPTSPDAVPARSVPASAPTVPADVRKSPPEDPSSGAVPSAGPAANRTSPATDPTSGTSPTSHSAGAPFKSAHTSTSDKEADTESLDLNMEITDEEDITGDEYQGSDDATVKKKSMVCSERPSVTLARDKPYSGTPTLRRRQARRRKSSKRLGRYKMRRSGRGKAQDARFSPKHQEKNHQQDLLFNLT